MKADVSLNQSNASLANNKLELSQIKDEDECEDLAS